MDERARTLITILDELLQDLKPRHFSIRLWDGSCLPPSEGSTSRFDVVLSRPEAARVLLSGGDLMQLGEAYIGGEFTVEGDIEAAFNLAYHLTRLDVGLVKKLDIAAQLRALPRARRPVLDTIGTVLSGRRSNRSRVRSAVSAHYDRPLEFWQLWLDPSLQYTCAYYASPSEELESAQRRKLDWICRKLQLYPGDRFVDLGCGWGGLLIHAVRKYHVEGVGVTLSEKQAAYARYCIARAGVGDHASIIVADIRDMDKEVQFDKGAGVGIIEHLGEGLQPDYFQLIRSLLRPGGLFLNQGITVSATAKRAGGREFLDRYIFPDHEIVPISTTLRIAEDQGLEIRDVESLREHYVLTLRAWLRRLEAGEEAITKLTNIETWRAFRVYLAGMARDFEQGGLNIYQTLLSTAEGGPSGLPLERSSWQLRADVS